MDKLTLESSIQHCEDVAMNLKEKGFEANVKANNVIDFGEKCYKCAEEYLQLAEWLKELKAYHEKLEISTGCVNNHNCNDCIHNTICTWRGAKFCDWYVQDCSDAISRQAVIDILSDKPAFTDTISSRDSIFDVKHLLPVTSKQKIGHWIAEIDAYGEVMRWHCDKCYEDSGFTSTCKWNFCPNCGAKMEVGNDK